VVADDSKLVATLGRFPLPIEIVRFGQVSTTRLVRDLLGDFGYPDVELTPRMTGSERLVTDSGNYIVDAHLQQVHRPAELTVELNRIPGVVENGLFVGIAREVVFGHLDQTADVHTLPLPLTQETTQA
jgi:ribose 5-phosphate isomerase A